jgi:excisionase family DNA binding protein
MKEDIKGRTISAQAAADLLGINRRTLTELAKAGKVPSLQSEGRYVFPEIALRNWLTTGSWDGMPDLVEMAQEVAKEVVREVFSCQESAKLGQLSLLDTRSVSDKIASRIKIPRSKR